MAFYRIPKELAFPDPNLADPDGLLGVGGDLAPERLLLGYCNGIFPWYHDGLPILWYSPDPRTVLFPDRLHLPRSLAKVVRGKRYEVRLDTAFPEVIQACREMRRPKQPGTWITRDMLDAYIELHRIGYAHSAEAWADGKLVGGLYGVAVGALFSGESMFAVEPDASKVAFVWMARQLREWGFRIIDCQVRTAHLARFGSVEIARETYLDMLPDLVAQPSRTGAWRFDDGFFPDTRSDAQSAAQSAATARSSAR